MAKKSFLGCCADRKGDDRQAGSDMEQDVVDELHALLRRWMVAGPAAEAELVAVGVSDAPKEGTAPAAGVGEWLNLNWGPGQSVVG